VSGVHVERRKIREGEEGEGEGEEQFNAAFRCDFSRASERRRDESYERGYFNRVTRDFKGYRARHVAIRETSDAVVMSCAMMMTKMMIQSRSCPFSSFGKEAKWKSFSSTTTREKRKRRVRRDASASTVLNEYESILNQSPMLVKSVTSLFGFGIADVVAQTLTTLTSADASRGSLVYLDKARTLRFAVFGFLFYGPTSSIWYSSLDTYVFPDAPTSGLAVASKVLADQILWAPVLISCLFAFDLAFDASETKKPSLSKKIENDLLSALKVNWSFWPLFHLFSFRYVSTEDRILYINCVQIAFNVFLVYTSSRREEEKEEPKNQNRGS